VHLLLHQREALSLLLCGSFGFDRIDSALEHVRKAHVTTISLTYLSLCFLLVLHFLDLGFGGVKGLPVCRPLFEGGLVRPGSERFLVVMPLLACATS
jgi:hypothetical protein